MDIRYKIAHGMANGVHYRSNACDNKMSRLLLVLLITSVISTIKINSNPVSQRFLNRPLEELGGFFEGDMNLDPMQLRDIFTNAQVGLIDTRRRWPRAPGGQVTVPFAYRERAPYSASQRNLIQNAMNEIQLHTCIRFVPRQSQTDFIEIFAGNGCWSHVGRIGGRQELSLAHFSHGTCVTHGIVIHELLHALGIYHMQSATNRDQFVRINHENILPGMEHNFLRYESNHVSMFSTSYDYESIMHYARNAFSRNGRDTITTLNSSMANRIGQRNQLSPGDITRIRNMYNC